MIVFVLVPASVLSTRIAIATVAKEMPQGTIMVRIVSLEEEIKSCHPDWIAWHVYFCCVVAGRLVMSPSHPRSVLPWTDDGWNIDIRV